MDASTDLPSLEELRGKFQRITRNMAIEDAQNLEKGVTPKGMSATDPIVMEARRVLSKIKLRERSASDSEA